MPQENADNDNLSQATGAGSGKTVSKKTRLRNLKKAPSKLSRFVSHLPKSLHDLETRVSGETINHLAYSVLKRVDKFRQKIGPFNKSQLDEFLLRSPFLKKKKQKRQSSEKAEDRQQD